MMPLNKYLSSAGVCSRRKAVELIQSGLVEVNKVIVREPFFRVSDSDTVVCNGEALTQPSKHIYLLLNKPEGYITTTSDEFGRKTVLELVAGASEKRIYPIGRLDYNSSGLLLLTSDGDFAQKVAHPKNNIQKGYTVSLDRPLSLTDFNSIKKGIMLNDGFIKVDDIVYKSSHNKREIFVTLHSGRNRIVRRIFGKFNYTVKKLDRALYASLTQAHLPCGTWRALKEGEIQKIISNP
jgi:23S rRNA pseudouridine2605 synthase